MSELALLKEKIYVDERIEDVLNALGCGHIRKEGYKDIYVASLPQGNNSRSVQVHINESLTTYVRSKGVSGDIYSLIGYILYDCQDFDQLKKHLNDCKIWVAEQLGYPEFLSGKKGAEARKQVRENYTEWLKKIQDKRKNGHKQTLADVKPNRILSEHILKEFKTPTPHMLWKNEGISLRTQVEFEVGFDLQTDRITFAVRNKDGQLVGVKGRYVGDNEYIKKEKKYLYIYKCNKGIELFNLHRALPYILEKNEVIVVEGGKSCMLGWQYRIRNVVSIEGDSLTPFQAQLLKELGLNVKVTFFYDKDKDVKFIKKNANLVENREVYAVFDKDDLLEGKDSPFEKGADIFNTLYEKYNFKIKVNK